MKTNLEVDQRYIQEKLSTRVRIALERTGVAQSPEVDLFEASKASGALLILKNVSGKVRRHLQNNSGEAIEGYPAMKKQIDAIESLVKEHAKNLSMTAADQNENVQALTDSDFDNMAKTFEKMNSKHLRVTPPTTWV